MNTQHLTKICNTFSLGQPLGEALRVVGGLLHRMWKINTTSGMYAVKELSADQIQDEAVKRHYEWTEEVAARFAEQGLPAIAALKSQGKHLLEIEGAYFLVYPWVEGIVIDSKCISQVHALKIAEVLAQIHCTHLVGLSMAKLPEMLYTAEQLQAIFKKAEAFRCPFAADLRAHEPDLLAMQEAHARSIAPLKQHEVLTHGDLDQKNVLWTQAKQPILIDWEAASLINPTYDLINTALNWSGIITAQFDQDLFLQMIRRYQHAGGVIDKKLLPSALDGAYSWINWMVYNIERACTPAESEQKTIGIAQVGQTLAALLRLKRYQPCLLAALCD